MLQVDENNGQITQITLTIASGLQYWPDLTPRDFYLLAALKKMLTRETFRSNDEAIAETKATKN